METEPFTRQHILKKDAFGSIEKGTFTNAQGEKIPAIKRLYATHHLLRPIAKILARKETKALKKLHTQVSAAQIPKILAETPGYHIRSYLDGVPMHHFQGSLNADFFFQCRKLILQMRKVGVCNNDLAKEANWLITGSGLPALMDFQLAVCFKNPRNRFFLTLCYDDLRHLLKHKRKYVGVNAQEQILLAKKSVISRLWKVTGKKIYLFVTRKMLGWQERSSAEERDF